MGVVIEYGTQRHVLFKGGTKNSMQNWLFYAYTGFLGRFVLGATGEAVK